ncbi:uncharacterized protein SEPMUDRAFT_121425 [Sphaerulina musiva SO2202]|uniref:Uncharacterized protein n=1 Tax=Sphaerulina musiva (strain SO2202) TaxID=692275 RepID=M3CX04_SPHMS|nr:uncharacterized protein SEPMUDRAFT_121425 [Sphaerulina musiva SO2202]EMF08652.1 hypothetical protein SEPMUDRAFT_121425 [Sphaerulina musiva SO2202]
MPPKRAIAAKAPEKPVLERDPRRGRAAARAYNIYLRYIEAIEHMFKVVDANGVAERAYNGVIAPGRKKKC